jgi:hypothetical protein
MYFRKSSNGGASWSARQEVSTAPVGTDHAFPAIAAKGNGDVRISWMDNRETHGGTPAWNTYYRSSANGGGAWSVEVDLSTFVDGFSYIWAEGFSFPFGDYYEMTIGPDGKSHVVWGEGLNYDAPGSIWYAQGR